MKLVYTLGAAALTGLALAQEGEELTSDLMPVEDMPMEDPWWKFLEEYGLDVDEKRTLFKMDDPSIYFLNQHDGMKMNLRTPWYTRKYEIKEKETATSKVSQFAFKETVPKWKVLNAVDTKTGIYNKNEKVLDENCTENDPKKCEIKIPVGKQNKWDFAGEHRYDGGKFKVMEKTNYVHDLEGYPMSLTYQNGWDFWVADASGPMEMMEMVMPSEMPMVDDENMDENMDDNMDDMPMMTPWYSNGWNKYNVKMTFTEPMENPMTGEMEKHWQSSEWDFEHFANHTNTPIVDMKMYGTSQLDAWNFDNATMTATVDYGYTVDSNINWSQTGNNHQVWENVDSCMMLVHMVMEGDWESFFMGSFEDKPCMWTSVVEGNAEWVDMETGEDVSMPYRHGLHMSITAFMDWSVSYLAEAMEEEIQTEEDNWMHLFGISTEMNEQGEHLRTITCHGEDMITVNCEKLMAHHMEMQDKWARTFFMVYKKVEYMQQQMMMIDWADEEAVGQCVSKMWNMDYVVSMMGEMEAECLESWREMECAYPHYDMMEEMMGLTVHEPLQAMCYEKKSYLLQKMNLIKEVEYFEMAFGYGKYLNDPTGMMSQHDIMKMIMMMDYADQYEYVANALESGELNMYPDMEFMLYITGMVMEEDWTEEDEQNLIAAFDEMKPTPEKLREYAQTIRDFEVVEMSNQEINEALNAKCNEEFDMVKEWHTNAVAEKVQCISETRVMAEHYIAKQHEWIAAERATVEAMFDAEHALVESMMNGLWECEYLYFGAPEGYMVMFDNMTEECKTMLMEKYEGIESWQLDGIIEDDDMVGPME